MHGRPRMCTVKTRGADHEVILMPSKDGPGLPGNVSGPMRVGRAPSPGMISGIASAVTPEQLILGVRPSASDPGRHDNLYLTSRESGREDGYPSCQPPSRRQRHRVAGHRQQGAVWRNVHGGWAQLPVQHRRLLAVVQRSHERPDERRGQDHNHREPCHPRGHPARARGDHVGGLGGSHTAIRGSSRPTRQTSLSCCSACGCDPQRRGASVGANRMNDMVGLRTRNR